MVEEREGQQWAEHVELPGAGQGHTASLSVLHRSLPGISSSREGISEASCLPGQMQTLCVGRSNAATRLWLAVLLHPNSAVHVNVVVLK